MVHPLRRILLRIIKPELDLPNARSIWREEEPIRRPDKPNGLVGTLHRATRHPIVEDLDPRHRCLRDKAPVQKVDRVLRVGLGAECLHEIDKAALGRGWPDGRERPGIAVREVVGRADGRARRELEHGAGILGRRVGPRTDVALGLVGAEVAVEDGVRGDRGNGEVRGRRRGRGQGRLGFGGGDRGREGEDGRGGRENGGRRRGDGDGDGEKAAAGAADAGSLGGASGQDSGRSRVLNVASLEDIRRGESGGHGGDGRGHDGRGEVGLGRGVGGYGLGGACEGDCRGHRRKTQEG